MELIHHWQWNALQKVHKVIHQSIFSPTVFTPHPLNICDEGILNRHNTIGKRTEKTSILCVCTRTVQSAICAMHAHSTHWQWNMCHARTVQFVSCRSWPTRPKNQVNWLKQQCFCEVSGESWPGWWLSWLRYLHGFRQSAHTKARVVPYIRPQPFYSKSLAFHYSL
jgi:hypothetical protein